MPTHLFAQAFSARPSRLGLLGSASHWSPSLFSVLVLLTLLWLAPASHGQASGNPPPPMQVPTLLSVSGSPTSVTGGTASTGTVTVSGQGYTFIGLSSSDPAVQVPSSVAVGGSATTTFSITTSAVSSPVTATITATETFAQNPPRSPIAQTTTLTVNPASATYTIDLSATATGSNKVTLYWAGYNGAVGYNIYRGLQSGGPYTKINSSSPVSTPDNSPGLTNVFMYTDSQLATGTTYYYYVAPVMQNGTETGQSNEDSATPNASAVPWDTADPTQIINAVNATAALDLEPDMEDSGTSYPAQVGVLQVAGPDGAVYMGNFPDGSPAQAFTSHAYSDGYSINYDDGTVVAVPGYDESYTTTAANAATGAGGTRPASQSGPVSDKSAFPATKIPSGIYREINSVPGYTGFSALVGLPNPSDTQTVRIMDHLSTSQPGSGASDIGKHYPDAIDIYTGGAVYQGGAVSNTIPLDAGLQLTLAKTQAGNYVQGYWAPGINARRPDDLAKYNPNSLLPSVFLDGSSKALPAGKVEYKVRLFGELRMQFLTPAAPHVANESVELHFSLPLTGLGTGQIGLARVNPSNPDNPPVSNVSSVTLVYYHVSNWLKTSKFVIKRINSIAQSLKSPTPSLVEQQKFDPFHQGAPFANAPTSNSVATKGYLNDGTYAVAPFGSGSFAGAYWGNADSRGVELRDANGGWISWTDDASITNAAGAYPDPNAYGNIVNWLEQNPFFWEQNVNLNAR